MIGILMETQLDSWVYTTIRARHEHYDVVRVNAVNDKIHLAGVVREERQCDAH